MLYKLIKSGCAKPKKKQNEGSGDEEVNTIEDYAALASFALGELGLRLYDFYCMPLNEILIAMDAWDKKREREILNSQFIAYHAMIGSHLNPKSIPSFEKFIGKKNTEPQKASDRQKELMLAAAAEYYKKINKEK